MKTMNAMMRKLVSTFKQSLLSGIVNLSPCPSKRRIIPILAFTSLFGLLPVSAGAGHAQSDQTLQQRVAATAIDQWKSFSATPAVVKNQNDVDRLAHDPQEYSKCETINLFWSKGVQGSPPSGTRSKNTCLWPKVAYFCIINGQQVPNAPSCGKGKKDEVWDRAPWSAAFVSYVFRSAGAGNEFVYSGSHSTYIVEAIRNAKGMSSKSPKFFGYSIRNAVPEVGDLVCAPRGSFKGKDFEDIPLEPRGAFQSHCDIVISAGPGRIELVGGNVGDTVAKTIVNTDTRGHIIIDQPEFRRWFVVIKSRPVNAK